MHYKNNRIANVGDPVVGTCYNTNGIIAGTLVSITPGPDSCSALVGFLTLTLADPETGKIPTSHDTLVRMQGTQHHGASGTMAITSYKQDYTECKNLLHADDCWNL